MGSGLMAITFSHHYWLAAKINLKNQLHASTATPTLDSRHEAWRKNID